MGDCDGTFQGRPCALDAQHFGPHYNPAAPPLHADGSGPVFCDYKFPDTTTCAGVSGHANAHIHPATGIRVAEIPGGLMRVQTPGFSPAPAYITAAADYAAQRFAEINQKFGGEILERVQSGSEISITDWSVLADVERERAAEENGYDADHDDEHGLHHLLAWADDYMRRGEVIKAAGLIRSARAYITRHHLDPVGPETSDEYHSIGELYEYRMLYHAHAVRYWLANGHTVVKSWRHSDGELCFGGGWFVVSANLPDGQVTNHYKAEHWELFRVPSAPVALEYDGHTPADVAERLRDHLRGDPDA